MRPRASGRCRCPEVTTADVLAILTTVDITDLVRHLMSPTKEGDGVQGPARVLKRQPTGIPEGVGSQLESGLSDATR